MGGHQSTSEVSDDEEATEIEDDNDIDDFDFTTGIENDYPGDTIEATNAADDAGGNHNLGGGGGDAVYAKSEGEAASVHTTKRSHTDDVASTENASKRTKI